MRAVADGAAAEAVALNRACETLTDAGARNLDVIARAKHTNGDGLANGEVGRTAELRQMTMRSDAGLLKMAGFRLGKIRQINCVIGELNTVVPIDVKRAHTDDRARARLDHGHGQARAVLREELGHAQFASDDCFHDLELDLDVDAGWQIKSHQRIDRLRRGGMDVDQPLMGADLEVFPRILVLERRSDHAVDVLLGRQRNRAGDGRAGAHRRLDDVLCRPIQRLVVVALKADADFLLSQLSYLMIFVTTPAPTVRPPSRIAKRRPSSMAIG